jgi:hypothetical protein
MTPEQRCSLLTEKLEGSYERIINAALPAFTLRMPDHFLLNMERCFLVFPPENQTAQETFAALRKKIPEASNRICILISTNPDQQLRLRSNADDPARTLVVPSAVDLTELLLLAKLLEIFANIIAGYVRVTRISPYQNCTRYHRRCRPAGRVTHAR